MNAFPHKLETCPPDFGYGLVLFLGTLKIFLLLSNNIPLFTCTLIYAN
jgi:hypothetical protein